MMANRNVLTSHPSPRVESLIMDTQGRIIAGVNEHLRLIRAGIFSAARDHQSLLVTSRHTWRHQGTLH